LSPAARFFLSTSALIRLGIEDAIPHHSTLNRLGRFRDSDV